MKPIKDYHLKSSLTAASILAGAFMLSTVACKTGGSEVLEFEDTVLGQKDIDRLNNDFLNVMVRPRDPYDYLPFDPPAASPGGAAVVSYHDPDRKTYELFWRLYQNFVETDQIPAVMNKYALRVYVKRLTAEQKDDTPAYLKSCAPTSCKERETAVTSLELTAETQCELEKLKRFKARYEERHETISQIKADLPAANSPERERLQQQLVQHQQEADEHLSIYREQIAAVESLQVCWQRFYARRDATLGVNKLVNLLDRQQHATDNAGARDELRREVLAFQRKSCSTQQRGEAEGYLKYDLMNYFQPDLSRNLLVQARMGVLDGSIVQGVRDNVSQPAPVGTKPTILVAGSAVSTPDVFHLVPDKYFSNLKTRTGNLDQVDPGNSRQPLPDADQGEFTEVEDKFVAPIDVGYLIGLAQNDASTNLTKTILGTKFGIANLKSATEFYLFQIGHAVPVSFGILREEPDREDESISVREFSRFAAHVALGGRLQITCVEVCPAYQSRYVHDGMEGHDLAGAGAIPCADPSRAQ